MHPHHKTVSGSWLSDDITNTFYFVVTKVVRLMDEVESLFTQHFANNDRKKAMKFLRPQQNKDSHMVTFFVGTLSPHLSLYITYIKVTLFGNSKTETINGTIFGHYIINVWNISLDN